ncbi:hypothetical protein KKF82_07945 [Patescibacteria group bacterium]|nr:hypothetical protein [Patescibacteria group bacterium]
MHTSISVDSKLYNRLWQTKAELGKVGGRKLTWNRFMEQYLLLLDALLRSMVMVKAVRYNPYVYGANCPYCKTDEYPLRRRGVIIWKVKCSKCGKEYIALA